MIFDKIEVIDTPLDECRNDGLTQKQLIRIIKKKDEEIGQLKRELSYAIGQYRILKSQMGGILQRMSNMLEHPQARSTLSEIHKHKSNKRHGGGLGL